MELFESFTYKIIEILYPNKKMFKDEIEREMKNRNHNKLKAELKEMVDCDFLIMEIENKPRGRHYFKINPEFKKAFEDMIKLHKRL